MGEVAEFNKRLKSLNAERSSFIPVYRELSDYHLSYRGRFLTSDRNKGHKRNTKQYNNTSKMATRTLASGMMAGITSPARPWFQLGAPSSDPELNEYTPVKEWLFKVQTKIYSVFAHSNFYNSIHSVYGELGVFGTAPMGIYRDFNNVIWCMPETVGSYSLGADGRNRVDTRYREYDLTVGAVVKEFGLANCSDHVQQQWKSGSIDSWVTIVHAIEPNDDRDQMSPLAKNKPYRSVYYENTKGKANNDKFLRRSGFDTFPILAPRWDITGEDIYATDCPGMDALGDTKALQLGEKRKYQAVDKMANPILQGPISLRSSNQKGNMAGSEIIWVPDGSNDEIKSIYGNWRPDLNALQVINQESEERIKRSFYEDLFLMISQSDRRQVTAREIAEKQEEKLLMLGPVLERLHSELLDLAIDRTFDICNEEGLLPPPPPELENKELKVEYVSILAQAQRMVATSGMERLGNYTAELSTIWPEARHKFDAMQAIDEYAESVGTNPKLVRADDEANARVEAEQQAAQQQAAMEQGAAMASTAKTASETDTSGNNGLTDMMRQAGLM